MADLEEITGKLFLFAETGTEGGYWALQDYNHIKENVPRGYCTHCGLHLKKTNGTYKSEFELARSAKRWEDESSVTRPFCPPTEHKEDIGEVWDYEGLHVLENGDHLTIYEPGTGREVWTGTIDLKQHDLFTEHAGGLWIHADQRGIPRDEWAEFFFGNYTGKLKSAKK